MARGALVVLSSALGLELLLQLLAAAVWIGGSADADPEEARAEVVCVGDSYTFGMGASGPDAAYPSQLADLLSEQLGRTVEVQNLGKPGSDSSDVLERAGLALAGEPRVLCVLVGVNDRWRHPALIEELDLDGTEGAAARFEWKLRSVELVRILSRGLGSFQGDTAQAMAVENSVVGTGEARDLVGGWQLVPGDLPVILAENGSCRIGDADLAWGYVSGELRVGVPRDPTASRLEPSDAGVRSFRAERRELGWALTDAAGSRSALLPMDDLAAGEARSRLYLRQAEIGISEGRIDEFREVLPPIAFDSRLPAEQRAKALELLVVIAVDDAGSSGAIAERLERLRDLADGHDDVAVERSLVRSLMRAGRYDDAYERVERRAARSGSIEPGLRLAQARAASQSRTREDVIRIVSALLADPTSTVEVRNAARLIQLSVSDSQEDQIDVLVRAAAEDDRSGGDLTTEFQRRRSWLDEARVEAVARRLGVDPGPALERLRDAAAAEGGLDWRAVLTRHLARLHEACVARGVTLVALTYPFEIRELQETLRDFATSSGVRLAEMRSVFPTGEAERQPLFAPDGHCSDAGYALMARRVAVEIAEVIDD